MTKKLDPKKYKEQKDMGSHKVTVYMNHGHKWMLNEIAYLERKTQKGLLYQILEDYWVKKASKLE